MLDSLSVKNFALIKEAHIDFKNNLNVLTGETGSGKSILIVWAVESFPITISIE